MKHGKGEKEMSEEEVLEALEVIKEALMRTARCFFSCHADCEDAVQECFYKAWRGRESIQNPEYFKTWATRILVNECKTMLRKKVPIPMEADYSSVYYENEYENIVELDPLYKAMERIKEDDRQLIQRTNAADLQNTLAAVHRRQLVLRHEFLAELLIIQTVRGFSAARFAGVAGVNGFASQHGGKLLERCCFTSAEED